MEVASLKSQVASWLVIELQLRWLHSAVPVIIDGETLLWRDQRTTGRQQTGKFILRKSASFKCHYWDQNLNKSRPLSCLRMKMEMEMQLEMEMTTFTALRIPFCSEEKQTSVNLTSSLLLLLLLVLHLHLSRSCSLSPPDSPWTASISAGHSQHLRTAHQLSSWGGAITQFQLWLQLQF